ncbi:ESPR-type extended signal peptide-containing protein [Phascolarctobacterium succinatutens]|uniref:ESPR-type extended signal peptide-containing protein n=1 Tax=Phascolarctobacterium succinatutens TaxID=626940 RepID=UPI0023F804F8|nr:ESPR-type extended signal peptide-containing protein [Phascolarctobacterium succinatutens]
MNKVFKVIWSEARNAYVVVSEMAKSHGTKSCSTKKLLAMLIATGVMTCASVAPVMAANLAPEDYQIEAGNGASASGQGSVAIGNNAQASGLVGIAIGRDAEAIGSDSIAIGGKTKANQIYSVAIGNDISYIGYSSTAVGQQAYATGDVSTAIGTMTNVDADYNATHDDWRKAGYQSTAIGAYSGSWGIASTALGGYSRADEKFATAVGYGSHATAERATTLGAKAEANAYESVAIGAFSVADRESGAVGAFAPEGADSLTWKANRGAVSVGSSVEGEEITRQITNVAAGSEATDAVNVAQLKAATENAGWNLATNGVATEATKVKPGDYVDFSGDKNISVSHDGTKVQVKLNENIDVNSIKTNALNSKYNLSVGTMAENGIMPFLVNSTGAFYAANNNFSVDKDGKVIATAGEIGNVVLQNGVYTGNSALRDGELYVGDASGNYSQITTTGAKLGQVTIAADGKISGVAAGEADTDAVNVSQLNAVKETANKGWNLSTNGGEASKVAPDATVDFSGDKNISVSHDGTKVQVELNKNIDVNYVQTNALNSKYNLSVGTMAENGIMPFLVNSTGAFYAANNNFSVDKDGKVIATAGEIGNVVLQNGVYTGNSALRDGELYVGDASGNYSQITTTGAKLGQVTIAADGKISGVAAGEVSKTSTDAINGSQLNQTNENVAALDKRVTQNEADIAQNKADIAQNKADIAQNKADIAQNKADIAQNKADIAQNKADIAQNKADIAQNKADIATNKADIATNKADIATNKANIAQNAADIKKVEALAKKHTTVAAGDNITVSDVGPNAEGGKEYEVKLADNITVNSVTANTFKADQTVMDKDGLKVGDKVSVTATAVTAGKTSISDEGVKVGDKTYISADGLNANGQHITNVKAGEADTDAVNYGQLKDTNNRINQLGSRVNKVGAGAAALAALHPMDFDPDDKLTFSAGYGNYGGENAAAIGAYYRPDEKVMFSVAGTVGNGENMVNAGVSFALDRTNHVSNSRTALAREVIDLRGQLAVMGAKMAKMEKAFGMLDETKTKLFPDVPANHWAYEYIAKLAGNGYIEGYPDGNFGGDRLMTRYEFAAMLYRAIEKGAALEEKIIKEFEPELGRIRVDRISGEDGDRDKIERVRVNDTKGERDHYGNKLAK